MWACLNLFQPHYLTVLLQSAILFCPAWFNQCSRELRRTKLEVSNYFWSTNPTPNLSDIFELFEFLVSQHTVDHPFCFPDKNLSHRHTSILISTEIFPSKRSSIWNPSISYSNFVYWSQLLNYDRAKHSEIMDNYSPVFSDTTYNWKAIAKEMVLCQKSSFRRQMRSRWAEKGCIA